MYCPHCGREVLEGASTCPNCGGALAVPSGPSVPTQPAQPASYQPARGSSLAIASMATGIAGVILTFCFGFLGLLVGIAALIMGIVALRNASQGPADAAGKGMAIAGIVLGGISVALGLLAVFAIAGLALMGPRIRDIFGSIYNSINP